MERKGVTFTADHISSGRRSRMSNEESKVWCEKETARYRIVARDETALNPEDIPIIAEELNQRALNKIKDGEVRVIVGTMLQKLDPVRRAQVLASFDKDGNLVYPFTMVEG